MENVQTEAFDPQSFLTHLVGRFNLLEKKSTVHLPYATYLYLCDLYEPTRLQMPRLRKPGTQVDARGILEETLSVVEAYLHHADGQPEQARSELERLALLHPHRWEIPVSIGFLDVLEARYDQAAQRFEAFLQRHPGNRPAYRGLGTLYELQGEIDQAYRAWMKSFETEPLRFVPYIGSGRPLRVLLIESPMAGNILYARFLRNTECDIAGIFPEHLGIIEPLPEHDVVFNIIGDVDLCKPALESALHALRNCRKPIINHPSAVLRTSRIEMSSRLQNVQDVVSATMLEVERSMLLEPDARSSMEQRGFRYPYLLRSPGFANGQFFHMVENDEHLAEIARSLPRPTLIAMNFIDTRREDGTYRKYRVVRYDGVLYPIHLAVSYKWKIHYYSSDMFDHPEFREEEKLFLADMAAVLGDRVIAALHRVFDILNLDYSGIDFTIGPDGRLVVFEANATMALHDPPAEATWEYRRPPIIRAQQAAAAMVKARAATTEAG